MKIAGKLTIITIFGVLIAVGVLTYRYRQPAKPLVLPKVQIQQPVLEPVKPAIQRVFVPEINNPQNTLKYVTENFDLPREMKEDLISAQIEEENSIASESVDIAEIKAVVNQIRVAVISGRLQNCATGYYLPDKKPVTESISVLQGDLLQPSVVSAVTDNTDTASQSTQAQDNQVRVLTSDALATLGLMAMSRFEYSHAQEAFQSLISYYPDAQETPIARLELARLMYEQNRWDEARKIVDEALVYYAEDNEYKEIAQALNAAYLRNE